MLTFASFKRTNDCFTDFKKAKKMKKLVFMFVAIAAISFASCGNKQLRTQLLLILTQLR